MGEWGNEEDRNGHTITTAVPSATLSAHTPTGYAAFSTFAPGTTVPSVVSSAAPTLNLEYGPVYLYQFLPSTCFCATRKPISHTANSSTND